jgi:hypothetical protein
MLPVITRNVCVPFFTQETNVSSYYPTPSPTCHQERRRIEQVMLQCFYFANIFQAPRTRHNRTRWCSPQYSPKSPPQEIWKGWKGKSRTLDVIIDVVARGFA